MKAMMRLMTELSSRKFISMMVGKFAKSKYSKPLIPRFAKTYEINVEDAEKPVHDYASLNDFFTRKLKPHLRPIDTDPDTLISPVDGIITSMGSIQDGQLLNVKGQDYTIAELLNGSPRTVNYKDGAYCVLYLSPTDYHRIHVPVDGIIVEKEYIPGKVYPVNNFGLTHMRQVLSRNERLITYIQHAHGEVAIVKVGALNVSSIQYVEPLSTLVQRGQELAYFEFGSTVVLLMEDETVAPRDLHIHSKVHMGEALGKIKTKKRVNNNEQ